MSEMEQWEQELKDTVLPDTEEAQRASEKEFEKRVQKAIDRRIRTICLKTLAVVAAVGAVVFLGISPVMNAVYPSPEHPERGTDVDIYTYLDAYFETTRPYVEFVIPRKDDSYTARMDRLVRKKGFGCYEMDLDLCDPGKDGWVHVGDVDGTATLRLGKFAFQPGEATNKLLSCDSRFSGHGSTPEEAAALISDYPKASGGYFNITLKEPVAISSLRTEGESVLWAEVYNDETTDFRGGLRLRSRTSNGTQPWRQDLSDAELKEQFLQNIDTVLSAPKLLENLGLTLEVFDMEDTEGFAGGWQSTSDAAPYFEAARDAVAKQEGPLMTERIAVGGTQEELLAFLEREDIEKVNIESYYLQTLR